MQLYNKSTKVTKYTANSGLTGGVGGKSGSGWSVGRVRACVRACVARISSRQRTVVESVKQVYSAGQSRSVHGSCQRLSRAPRCDDNLSAPVLVLDASVRACVRACVRGADQQIDEQIDESNKVHSEQLAKWWSRRQVWKRLECWTREKVVISS